MMKEEWALSYLFGSNAPYIEALYESYLNDPDSIDAHWQEYFDALAHTQGATELDIPHAPIQESLVRLMKKPRAQYTAINNAEAQMMKKQVAVLRLITAYRSMGLHQAKLDPLNRMDVMPTPELDPAFYGLSDADMAMAFNVSYTEDSPRLSLSEIITRFKQTYCGSIGIEYMHINQTTERHWVLQRFESDLATPRYTKNEKFYILKQITAAETLERYLHTRYVGQKRFSLEGGESTIAGLNTLITLSARAGIEEIVIGMAHRGRLNVLVNTLGKLPRDLFSEFEGKHAVELPSGDVKYHMGFSSNLRTADGNFIHVALAFNPSHLEIVNPVVEGSAKARQVRRGATGTDEVMPVLIHGDSAFIGLGVNQATFNLSQVRGYSTGGTIHIVINNQIGFTTSDTRDTRSSTYCTDIAKMIDAPIIHVNADDPEAVCYVMKVALEYRSKFKKDFVIDLVCYRKLGHNEGDDPFMTQPMMYKKIAKHPGTRALYAQRLVSEGMIHPDEAEDLIANYRAALDKGEHVEQTAISAPAKKFAHDWLSFQGTYWAEAVDTRLSAAEIKQLAEKLTFVPDNFKVHPTVQKVLDARMAMGLGEQPVDWGMAETLAYASLLTHGHPVRLSGEDSGRGTFSHRHSVLHDQNREKWDQGIYIPLANISEHQASVVIIDSILNEEAVYAYEYGYACSSPDELVIWEAQFGDFANGAQVVIDQFISSGETKWGRLCGLTTILPHGYDGQGPEHSSGRIERWLQLCAEHNIQIVVLSEAAQMFHVMRRQMLRPYRKPLVIFMSKRLLRYKDSMSDLSELTQGQFKPVIAEALSHDEKQIERVLLCAGQVYYDLYQARKEQNLEDKIAIVRIEQLYPFPSELAAAQLERYKNAKEVFWVQEEPKNQGAWHQLRHRLEALLNKKQTLGYAGRPSGASPAVGYLGKHAAQLKTLLSDALTLDKHAK